MQEETTGAENEPQTFAYEAAEPDGDPPEDIGGVDIGAEEYDVLNGEGEQVAPPKESRSHETMRLMLDPANKESAKSLWRGLFEPSLSLLPNIENLKLKHSGDEKAAYLEWYNHLLGLHATYLQTAFEEPTTLPDLSKRIAGFLTIKRPGKLEWRQQWLAEYAKYRECAEKLERENREKAKAEALRKRQARLDEKRRTTRVADWEGDA